MFPYRVLLSEFFFPLDNLEAVARVFSYVNVPGSTRFAEVRPVASHSCGREWRPGTPNKRTGSDVELRSLSVFGQMESLVQVLPPRCYALSGPPFKGQWAPRSLCARLVLTVAGLKARGTR